MALTYPIEPGIRSNVVPIFSDVYCQESETRLSVENAQYEHDKIGK